MNKIAGMLVALFVVGTANATVVDIVDMGDGTFKYYYDGAPQGGAANIGGAQKFADKMGRAGNTVNWKTASSTTGAGTTGGTGSVGGAGSVGGQKATTSGTTQSSTTSSAKTTSSNVGGGQKALPGPASQKALPGPKATPATQTVTQKALPGAGGQKALPGPKATPATTTPKVNVGGAALGAIGVVTGAIGLYDSVKTKEEKTTWGDVGNGALSGMGMAASGAAIINAIPVGGQVAYGAAMLAGTLVGASGAGTKMFSQTDCDRDPVTGQYACCNVVESMSDLKGARYCNIGDEMFAEFPYVRTCMQGNNKYESNWLVARFLDDHWSDTADVKFCPGYEMPAAGSYNIQAYGSSEAPGKVCWQWECADPGMRRQGATCVSDSNGKPAPVAAPVKKQPAAKKDNTVNTKKPAVVATPVPGDVSGSDENNSAQPQQELPPESQTEAQPAMQPEAQSAAQPQIVRNNCEMGVLGYTVYDGVCMTTAQAAELRRAARNGIIMTMGIALVPCVGAFCGPELTSL